MKTTFKFLALAIMLTAFGTFAPAFGQAATQEECEALYKKYTDNYKGTLAQRKMAVEGGKQYIAKCSALEGSPAIIKYLNDKLPAIEKKIDFEDTAAAFNGSIQDAKNVNTDVAFTSGKRLLSNHDPNLVDVMIVLASVGFDKAVAKVDTHNGDAVSMAKQAIQKIEGGTTSQQYGAYGFTYKTKDNALAWMNYTVGYINYFRQNNKKEGIPYLYNATKHNTGAKDNPKNLPLIYQAIGDFYKDEYNRLDDERVKLAAEAKDKTPEEAKVIADKVKGMLLLQKGYAERMIDAYGRARLLATTDKPYQDALYNNLKVLYGFRFDGKTDGLDAYVSGLTGKPMPDPTSTVTPVPDTTPATTTTATPTSSNTLTTPTSNTTTTNARTTDANSTKQATTTNGATTTKAKTTPKTPAKPAPKKKGTR